METQEPDTHDGWRPPLPPWERTEAGRVRRVGVEIELIGPGVADAASTVAAGIGGEVREVSLYECVVDGDEAGPWRVELDFAWLKERGRAQAESGEDPSLVRDVSEAILRAGAEAVVPIEVVSPPLPLPRLAEVEALLAALRRSGAQGTRAGLTHAFGLQLNPEMPRCDAKTILAYLRAFLCLQDWLFRASRVDLTRWLTRYTAPFAAAYARSVVDPGYRPDLARLVDDYLAANPTRNRALDFLPLFAELDEARVRSVVDDARVKARPALHYRLPNSEIDDPEWGLGEVWRHWLQVEHLAADAARLAEACEAYAAFLARPLGSWLGDWADEVEPWLTEIRGS